MDHGTLKSAHYRFNQYKPLSLTGKLAESTACWYIKKTIISFVFQNKRGIIYLKNGIWLYPCFH